MYGASSTNGPTSGFNHAGGHPFFDGEISPEELFRGFFGQGGGGFHTFHMGGQGSPFFASQPFVYQRRRPNNSARTAANNASDFEGIRGLVRQLLPIIVFFIFSIFSSWM